MIGLMYRHVPVVEYAKELIATRELGDITQYRGFFLADYAADPKGILTWRYKPNDAGLGVLGDIMPHAVDMVQNLLGSIESASAKKESYPGAPGGAGGHGDGPLRCRFQHPNQLELYRFDNTGNRGYRTVFAASGMHFGC
jgi:predicted dehydrogenase